MGRCSCLYLAEVGGAQSHFKAKCDRKTVRKIFILILRDGWISSKLVCDAFMKTCVKNYQAIKQNVHFRQVQIRKKQEKSVFIQTFSELWTVFS